MILLSRNRHLPPFCVWHNKKQLVLRHDFIAGALKLLKDDPENYRHYQLVTENIRMILQA